VDALIICTLSRPAGPICRDFDRRNFRVRCV
jgi:hypothetical protein